LTLPKVFAEESTEDIAFIGGEWRRDVHFTVTDTVRDKIAQGYVCLNCLEEFRLHGLGPFPDVCPLPGCGYQPAKFQRADFDRKYRGVDTDIWVPS